MLERTVAFETWQYQELETPGRVFSVWSTDHYLKVKYYSEVQFSITNYETCGTMMYVAPNARDIFERGKWGL